MADDIQALVDQVPEPILDYIEELEQRLVAAESAGVAKADDNSDDLIEKALTALDPEVAEVIKSQRDQLAEAQAALEAEKVAKANSEWVAKVRPLDGIVDDPEKMGSGLREVADTNPELADSILSALQAANQRVAKSTLFGEVGHTRPAAGSPEEKIQNIAKALVEADPSKSMAEAEAEAWEANPELYDEYVANRRANKEA